LEERKHFPFCGPELFERRLAHNPGTQFLESSLQDVHEELRLDMNFLWPHPRAGEPVQQYAGNLPPHAFDALGGLQGFHPEDQVGLGMQGEQDVTGLRALALLADGSGVMVCRWGGEEFAGIFPHTDGATLEAIAERLHMLVGHSRVSTGLGELTVTVSIGGTLAAPDDSAASIVKRADTLMYASKTHGRNRVTIREAG
jgi:hypothetical protein